MSVPLRLAAFAFLLVLALGGGAALGDAVGPAPEQGAPGADHDIHETDGRG